MTDKLDKARPQSWGVHVSVDGENVLTIETRMLSGIPDIEKHRDIVLSCADMLRSFIGPDEGEFFDPDTASAAGGGTEANYTRSWITNCHIVEREPGDVYRLRLDRYTIVPTELAPTAYRDASRMRADTASAAGGGEPRGCPTPGACSCLPVQPAPAAEGGEPVPEPIYKAVERVLDEHSAWIARPNADVTKAVALAAGIAWSLHENAHITELQRQNDWLVECNGRAYVRAESLEDSASTSYRLRDQAMADAAAFLARAEAAEASLAALRERVKDARKELLAGWGSTSTPHKALALLTAPAQPAQDDDSPVPALLPCPFCGGENVQMCSRDARNDFFGHEAGAIIECRGCGAGMPGATDYLAAFAWNSRCIAPTPDAALSQLRSPTDG